jgi:two-component system, LytTR family, response regulator
METNDLIESGVIEIKTEKGFKMISYHQILSIRADKKKTIVQINDAESIKSLNSLKWFSQKLIPPDFFRCHNSYMVNCHHVDYFSTKAIILKGRTIVPLTRNKFLKLEEILAQIQGKL